MKAVVPVAALTLGLIPCALAQTTEGPTVLLPAGPTSLVATEHAPLPTDLSDYWFVPDAALGARRDAVLTSFARGVKAIADGDYSAGLELVSRARLDKTPLADYAAYYRAVALQGLSRLPEADAVLTALTANMPSGDLSETARLRLAEVALARDDGLRAERLLRTLTAETIGSADEALLMLGRVEEEIAHRGHAIEAYRRMYFRFPLSERASEAKAGIDRLQAGGLPSAPARDELARAERLFAATRWAEARAAFEPLVSILSGDDRDLATLRLAACEVRLGRHRAARDRLKPYLSGSPREAEARFFYLSAVRGLGDDGTYVKLSRALVADHPSSEWAVEALNDLASYYVIEDEDAQADRVFRELLERFPRHRHAERAAWKVGWAAYQSRQFAESARVFESAASAFPRADYRPSWLYWSGRARDRTGERRLAAARYQLVVTDYGSSYYGRLASRLLASRPGTPVPARMRVSTSDATAPAPPTAPILAALMSAGLYDDALREARYAQRTWGDSARLQATIAWIRHQQAQSLRAEERFTALRGAMTTMRRAYPQFLSVEGEALPAEVLRIIFPLDYWDLIEKYSRAHDLDPYLIAALMAQESSFTAEIRSPANARGLLQVMPGTGRRYARKLGIRRFTTASLSQPETNVRIGLRYFKDLMNRFGGAHYALAGYNAGESRVAEWIEEAPGLPPDEFVDNIPFPETQAYVKRILGTAEDYRRLYGTGLLTPGTRRASTAAD